MELFIIVFLIFFAVAALVIGAGSFSSARPVRSRLARLADGSAAEITVPEDDESVLRSADRGWLVRLLTPIAGKRARDHVASFHPMRRKLIQGGYRRESAVVVFMGSRILLALVAPVLVLISPLVWNLTELQLIAALCLASALGFGLPGYFVKRRTSSRQKEMINGLPDALDLMVVCVEAGLGINASLARVADEFSANRPILSSEFELVTLEIRAGKSSSDSLRALSERTGVSEVSSLVAMLVQTERFGTSLADTLRVHADSMRIKRLQRAEEEANKAPIKMLFPTVLIFCATLMVTVGPGVIALVDFFESSN
jgi:tight adherence protein C